MGGLGAQAAGHVSGPRVWAQNPQHEPGLERQYLAQRQPTDEPMMQTLLPTRAPMILDKLGCVMPSIEIEVEFSSSRVGKA